MILEKPNEIYTDFRIPGIVATKKGTLIRYCECRRERSDWASIDLKVFRSEDGGESWQTVLLIEGEGRTLNNPVMFVSDEKLIFLFCKQYKEIFKCISLDDGKSFTDAEKVDFENAVSFPYTVVAVGPGHGICHDGKLIVPAWFANNEEDRYAHRPSVVSTFYSLDGGETWRVGEKIFENFLINPSESALAVTKEGDFLISIRNEGTGRTRALAKSKSGIDSWYDLTFEENLPDPVCMGSMTHRDGVIYHSNCDNKKNRFNLTVKISDDCFKTFGAIKLTDGGGYSDLALVGNTLYVFHEFVRDHHFELHFERIEI